MKNYQKNIAGLVTAATVALVPVNNIYALSQSETIYAKLTDTGSVSTTSVVKHLKNDQKDNRIVDKTNLQNIENLNGFETFIVEGDQIIWQADGKDIYYRGEAKKELPVQVSATYKMNGETKNLDEMLGKSGNFEISYKFKNLSKVGNLYTPFVAAFTTTFKEGSVSKLEVTNGKVASNGRTLAVAAVAAPGLYESLGIKELKSADEIVLKFETEKFELNDIYIAITPKLLDSADLKAFAELDNLSEKANTLATSSKQLVNGSVRLSTGLKELQSGVMAAKQQIGAFSGGIDNATMTQIKNLAAKQAERAVEAKRPEIEAGVEAEFQGQSGAILLNALHLQAEAMCSAQIGGGACPSASVQTIEAQLLATVKQQLVENSLALAKQTARETASATAAQVATQVAGTMQTKVAPAVSGALDKILGGINQLAEGANELSSGMTKFDQEGIQPLANFVNGKVRVTTNKMKQLLQLADNYQSYSGTADGAKSDTKFILMIEKKKAE